MLFYSDLRPKSDFEDRDYTQIFPKMKINEKKRAIDGILRLKTALDQQIPKRDFGRNLLIASWNIKEFGHTKQRLPESYFYLAEIISRFDVMVVQEIKSTLKDLQIVMRLLGDDWRFLVNDITSGDAGNSERSAMIYNTRRVELSGLAGELILWDDLTAGSSVKQLKRTPYLTGFRSGWKEFAILSLHLEQGDSSEKVAHRMEEVRLLCEALEEKMKETWTSKLVLAGDFNFYDSKDGPAIDLLEDAGFAQIDELVGKDTNASGSEAFDRLFVKSGDYFALGQSAAGSKGGVFDPFETVFREGEEKSYKKAILDVYGGSKDLENDDAALAKQYQVYWKRNQISDHLPIWFELLTDSSEKFLTDKRSQL